MFRWQITLCVKGERLLRAHHDGIDETPHQHYKAQKNVHDADVLVIDAGEPFLPEIGQPAFDDHPDENAEEDQYDDRAGDERNRLVERNRVPGELAQHYGARPCGITFCVPDPPRPLVGPSPGGSFCCAIASNKVESTPR